MLKKIALTATVISTIFGIMKDCNAMRRAPSPIEKIDPVERKHNERTAGIQNCETKIKQACENQTGESLANSINAVFECNPDIQNSLSATTPSFNFLKRCCSNISTYLYLPVEPTLP